MRKRSSIVAVSLALALSACSSGEGQNEAPAETSPVGTSESTPEASPSEDSAPIKSPNLVLSVKNKVGVDFTKTLTVSMEDGELSRVQVRGVRFGERGETEDQKVNLAGEREGNQWTAASLMEPSTEYVVTATDVSSGEKLTKTFRTDEISLSKQTYPTVFPSGGTFGVGQPIVVRFDVPVENRQAFEEALAVKTVPAQAGSWRWFSSQEVRYRPKTYWKPGTKITVDAAVNSVPAGNGVFGQFDRSASFRIGAPKVLRVDLQEKVLRAYEGKKLIRTIPISAGKPGFITRSGTKVIMSKHRYYDMNSSTIGIDPNSSEGYDLSNVEYAMRITNSGEFIHASPWNNGLHGVANLSHGCSGATIADTRWIFHWAPVGTPVEYTGSNRQMTVDNGWGDWAISFNEYKKGSALAG